jgi:hypothetical protein
MEYFLIILIIIESVATVYIFWTILKLRNKTKLKIFKNVFSYNHLHKIEHDLRTGIIKQRDEISELDGEISVLKTELQSKFEYLENIKSEI